MNSNSTLISTAFPSGSPTASQIITPTNLIKHGAGEHQGSNERGGRVKVPANGFLLFRADYKAIQDSQVAAGGQRKKQTEITKDAAVAWKALRQVVRDDYLARARHNLAEHKREHREFWSQRRGRDGRFLSVPAGAASPTHGDSQPASGTASSPLHISNIFLSPSGPPSIPSLDVAPEVILDSLDLPVSGASATTPSHAQPLRFYDRLSGLRRWPTPGPSAYFHVHPRTTASNSHSPPPPASIS